MKYQDYNNDIRPDEIQKLWDVFPEIDQVLNISQSVDKDHRLYVGISFKNPDLEVGCARRLAIAAVEDICETLPCYSNDVNMVEAMQCIDILIDKYDVYVFSTYDGRPSVNAHAIARIKKLEQDEVATDINASQEKAISAKMAAQMIRR